MPPTRIEVAASAGAYPVIIGSGTLATLPRLLEQSALGPSRVIVTSPVVWDLHGAAVRRVSSEAPILVPDGERFKNSVTVGRVYQGLLDLGADRSIVIVAVGGV
jgi:3-dehydroquinate synthetase